MSRRGELGPNEMHQQVNTRLAQTLKKVRYVGQEIDRVRMTLQMQGRYLQNLHRNAGEMMMREEHERVVRQPKSYLPYIG